MVLSRHDTTSVHSVIPAFEVDSRTWPLLFTSQMLGMLPITPLDTLSIPNLISPLGLDLTGYIVWEINGCLTVAPLRCRFKWLCLITSI